MKTFQVYELHAFIEDDTGGRRPFHLNISKPRPTEGHDDYHCIVASAELYKRPINIYGVDEKQAYQLSFDFVRSVLEGRRIVDKDGNEVHM